MPIESDKPIFATDDGIQALDAYDPQTGQFIGLPGFPELHEEEALQVLSHWSYAFQLAAEKAPEISAKMKQGIVTIGDEAQLALSLRSQMTHVLNHSEDYKDIDTQQLLEEAFTSINAISENNASEITDRGLQVAKLIIAGIDDL